MAKQRPCKDGKHDPYQSYYVALPCFCRDHFQKGGYEEHCRKCGWYYCENDPCGEQDGCSKSSYKHRCAMMEKSAHKHRCAMEEHNRNLDAILERGRG